MLIFHVGLVVDDFKVVRSSLKLQVVRFTILFLSFRLALLLQIQVLANLGDEELGREIFTKRGKNDKECLLKTSDVSEEVKDLS